MRKREFSISPLPRMRHGLLELSDNGDGSTISWRPKNLRWVKITHGSMRAGRDTIRMGAVYFSAARRLICRPFNKSSMDRRAVFMRKRRSRAGERNMVSGMVFSRWGNSA